MAISGERVENQNCVCAIAIDFSPGLIGKSCSLEPTTGFKIEIESLGELAISDRVSHQPGASCGWSADQLTTLLLGDELRGSRVFRYLEVHLFCGSKTLLQVSDDVIVAL